jgi:hypothetical protein
MSSTEMDPHEKAMQEWHDMSLRERLAAVDPEGAEELLLEYVAWLEERGKLAEDIRKDTNPAGIRSDLEYHIDRHVASVGIFMDRKYGALWQDCRARELREGDPDGSYERSVDA